MSVEHLFADAIVYTLAALALIAAWLEDRRESARTRTET
jgi:hypothetical protein